MRAPTLPTTGVTWKRIAMLAYSNLLLSLSVLACLFSSSPKARYLEGLATVYPMYDAQNMQLALGLPIPLNTMLLKQIYAGPTYGRRLELYYSSSLTFDDIKAFYIDYLTQTGWTVTSFDFPFFIYDDTCIGILTPSQQDIGNLKLPTPEVDNLIYSVSLWHDFFTQPFSIPTPQGANLCGDATDCETCP